MTCQLCRAMAILEFMPGTGIFVYKSAAGHQYESARGYRQSWTPEFIFIFSCLGSSVRYIDTIYSSVRIGHSGQGHDRHLDNQ
jgi:hypothetical protein